MIGFARIAQVNVQIAAIITCALFAAPATAAPPANDNCANAIPATLNTLVNFNTTEATTDGSVTTGCFFNNGSIVRDIWYTFIAPDTDEYRVLLCGSAYDSRLAVYDSCACGSLPTAPISCDDDFCDPGLQSEVDFQAVQGQCYLIRIGGYLSSGGTEYFGAGQMLITIAPPPPVNDLCGDAIAINVPSVTAGTTTDSTEDEEFNGCGTGFISYVGVWYKVIGTGTSMIATTCGGADWDTKITVFCGGCEQEICVGGNNDYNCTAPPPIERQSRVSWCSSPGEEYLILVHGTLGDFGPFELSVTTSGSGCSNPFPCAFPTNDDCANPLAVSDGVTNFDTRLATTDGPEHDLCDVGNGFVHQDLWFLYTATCTGNATFSTCGSNFDCKMAIYNGPGCTNLEGRLMNCSQDYDCNGNGPDINDRNSQITIPVACGLQYLIRVGGDNLGDAHGGNLTISCMGEPCPDPCPGDLNDSGDINVTDLFLLLSNWGDCDPPTCPPYCPGDLNRNCTVNVGDLFELLAAWGACD